MKYDLRILRPQCYHCNINLGGNGAVFFSKMQREIGARRMATLVKQKDESRAKTTKALPYYIALLPKYTRTLEEVQAEDKFGLFLSGI